MQSVVFFDIDDTIVRGQSQQKLIRYLWRKNIMPARAMLRIYAWFLLYRCRLVRDPLPIMEYAFQYIAGWKPEAVQALFEQFFQDVLQTSLNQPVMKKIAWHRSRRHRIVILTNALQPLAEVIGKAVGAATVIGTRLDMKRGKYTGKIAGGIMYGENKLRAMRAVLRREKKDVATYVYSDHISDLPLFEQATYATVINPSGVLRRLARQHRWQIVTT